MTDLKAAKIIDELITLIGVNQWDRKIPDYNIIADGLAYIAETKRENPQHPVTVWLMFELRRRGLIR